MLSDNIRNNRKKINLSQDELAEKVGVSRQSVSFWETGQTQPTIDNIIALSKIFNISSDELLDNFDNKNIINDVQPDYDYIDCDYIDEKKEKGPIITIVLIVVALIVTIILVFPKGSNKDTSNSGFESQITSADSDNSVNSNEEIKNYSDLETDSKKDSSFSYNEESKNNITSGTASNKNNSSSTSSKKPSKNNNTSSTSSNKGKNTSKKFDLFSYCKDFAIKKGELNGDYCIYQEPATKYGGYNNEYFSISYWADSNMVEFCLHCPLSDTQSHNFYLRMRGGYNKKYEYLSSKYYRDTGDSIRSASGYIDPSVFSESYPISCDDYDGSVDGQTEFMEESRIGICDLIKCLKKFVEVENMECSFSDFDFVNF